ncbi:unnamed protein product [Amoebophrya sp. A120]|nr:unnamed protein product [Amoebophrya sp. A120]|eukprot:GSA120T00023266001.1
MTMMLKKRNFINMDGPPQIPSRLLEWTPALLRIFVQHFFLTSLFIAGIFILPCSCLQLGSQSGHDLASTSSVSPAGAGPYNPGASIHFREDDANAVVARGELQHAVLDTAVPARTSGPFPPHWIGHSVLASEVLYHAADMPSDSTYTPPWPQPQAVESYHSQHQHTGRPQPELNHSRGFLEQLHQTADGATTDAATRGSVSAPRGPHTTTGAAPSRLPFAAVAGGGSLTLAGRSEDDIKAWTATGYIPEGPLLHRRDLISHNAGSGMSMSQTQSQQQEQGVKHHAPPPKASFITNRGNKSYAIGWTGAPSARNVQFQPLRSVEAVEQVRVTVVPPAEGPILMSAGTMNNNSSNEDPGAPYYAGRLFPFAVGPPPCGTTLAAVQESPASSASSLNKTVLVDCSEDARRGAQPHHEHSSGASDDNQRTLPTEQSSCPVGAAATSATAVSNLQMNTSSTEQSRSSTPGQSNQSSGSSHTCISAASDCPHVGLPLTATGGPYLCCKARLKFEKTTKPAIDPAVKQFCAFNYGRMVQLWRTNAKEQSALVCGSFRDYEKAADIFPTESSNYAGAGGGGESSACKNAAVYFRCASGSLASGVTNCSTACSSYTAGAQPARKPVLKGWREGGHELPVEGEDSQNYAAQDHVTTMFCGPEVVEEDLKRTTENHAAQELAEQELPTATLLAEEHASRDRVRASLLQIHEGHCSMSVCTSSATENTNKQESASRLLSGGAPSATAVANFCRLSSSGSTIAPGSLDSSGSSLGMDSSTRSLRSSPPSAGRSPLMLSVTSATGERTTRPIASGSADQPPPVLEQASAKGDRVLTPTSSNAAPSGNSRSILADKTRSCATSTSCAPERNAAETTTKSCAAGASSVEPRSQHASMMEQEEAQHWAYLSHLLRDKKNQHRSRQGKPIYRLRTATSTGERSPYLLSQNTNRGTRAEQESKTTIRSEDSHESRQKSTTRQEATSQPSTGENAGTTTSLSTLRRIFPVGCTTETVPTCSPMNTTGLDFPLEERNETGHVPAQRWRQEDKAKDRENYPSWIDTPARTDAPWTSQLPPVPYDNTFLSHGADNCRSSRSSRRNCNLVLPTCIGGSSCRDQNATTMISPPFAAGPAAALLLQLSAGGGDGAGCCADPDGAASSCGSSTGGGRCYVFYRSRDDCCWGCVFVFDSICSLFRMLFGFNLVEGRGVYYSYS